MKLRSLVIYCVLLVLVGCNNERPGQVDPGPALVLPASIDDQNIDPSQWLEQLLSRERDEALQIERHEQLLIATIDLHARKPMLAGIDGERPQGITAAALASRPELDLIIGSGFVSELHGLNPLGLLQIDGVVISKIQRHGYTRVLGFADDRVGVVNHLNYERGLFHSALQLGPGVIEQGELDISPRDLERQPYFRTLIGTCGNVLTAVASLQPMHLYTLGQQLLTFYESRQLQCDEVVNLAGDREVVFAVRSGEQWFYWGNPRTAKAALVGFGPVSRGKSQSPEP